MLEPKWLRTVHLGFNTWFLGRPAIDDFWCLGGLSNSEPFWKLFSDHPEGPPSGRPPRYVEN